MSTRWPTLATLVLLLVLAVACGDSENEAPTVKILSPLDPFALQLGETLVVESRANDDTGVDQVELRVDGVQVDLVQVPEGEKSFRSEQSWLAPQAGRYSVSVVAYDKDGQTSEPAAISVDVQPAPTLAPTSTPAAASLPTPTLEPTLPVPNDCTYDSAYVADVTISDDTELAPGAPFVKTWRLRNNGTCPWGSGTRLVFVDGDRMGGTAAVEVPATPPGETVDLEVPLIAPDQPGTYRGAWRMQSPSGDSFGDRPYVQIVVSMSVTVTPAPTPTETAPPMPDLDITLVSGNLQLEIGQPLELLVTIRNAGSGSTTQPADVRVVLLPGLETQTTVPTLPPSGEVVAAISHSFVKPAELDVFISVDPENLIAEEDETNNTERIPVVINPPLYVTRTITATPGLRFDLDDDATEEDALDIDWRIVEGTVYVGLLNGAGAVPFSPGTENVSYALVSGLSWETDQIALRDLTEGTLFGFRTSDERVGYARVDEVLDEARTRARLSYTIWDWP